MTADWVTAQMRVRARTHEYLKEQAAENDMSVTVVAGAILAHACAAGWQVHPPSVTGTEETAIRARPADHAVSRIGPRIAGQVQTLTTAEMATLAVTEALVRVTDPDGRTAAGRVLDWHAGPCLIVVAGPAGLMIVPSEPGWAVTELADEDAGYVTGDRLAAALDIMAARLAVDLPPSDAAAGVLLRILREEL